MIATQSVGQERFLYGNYSGKWIEVTVTEADRYGRRQKIHKFYSPYRNLCLDTYCAGGMWLIAEWIDFGKYEEWQNGRHIA